MTAIAPAPAHAPPPAHSAHPAHAPPPAQDHLAFSAVLDSAAGRRSEGEAVSGRAGADAGRSGAAGASASAAHAQSVVLQRRPGLVSACRDASGGGDGGPQAEPGAPALAASATARTPDPAAIPASRAATHPAAETAGARLAGERTFHASGPALSAAAASAPPAPSTAAGEPASPTNAIRRRSRRPLRRRPRQPRRRRRRSPSPPDKRADAARIECGARRLDPDGRLRPAARERGPPEGRAADRRRRTGRPSRRARREAGFEAGREPRRRGIRLRPRRVRRPAIQRRAQCVSVFAFGAAARRRSAAADRLRGPEPARPRRRRGRRRAARRPDRGGVPGALGRPGQGDRRRPLAGRARECLDDDAARGRQAVARHPRGELPDHGRDRRGARRDRRADGRDRPAARLSHHPADGFSRWNEREGLAQRRGRGGEAAGARRRSGRSARRSARLFWLLAPLAPELAPRPERSPASAR